MTLESLIAALTELLDSGGYDPGTEVRLAIQPAWPFEHAIDTVAAVPAEPHTIDVIYLTEGEQIGYLPGIVRDHLDW